VAVTPVRQTYVLSRAISRSVRGGVNGRVA